MQETRAPLLFAVRDTVLVRTPSPFGAAEQSELAAHQEGEAVSPFCI